MVNQIKAFRKVGKEDSGYFFPRSFASYIACRRLSKALVVECPFHAYYRTSILLSNSGSNFVMVKPSIILAQGASKRDRS